MTVKLKIISVWKNKKYPGKTMSIVDHPKHGLSVFDGDGILNLMPETFIGYEKLLYSDGWRKVPK